MPGSANSAARRLSSLFSLSRGDYLTNPAQHDSPPNIPHASSPDLIAVPNGLLSATHSHSSSLISTVSIAPSGDYDNHSPCLDTSPPPSDNRFSQQPSRSLTNTKHSSAVIHRGRSQERRKTRRRTSLSLEPLNSFASTLSRVSSRASSPAGERLTKKRSFVRSTQVSETPSGKKSYPPSAQAWIAGLREQVAYDIAPLTRGEGVGGLHPSTRSHPVLTGYFLGNRSLE